MRTFQCFKKYKHARSQYYETYELSCLWKQKGKKYIDISVLSFCVKSTFLPLSLVGHTPSCDDAALSSDRHIDVRLGSTSTVPANGKNVCAREGGVGSPGGGLGGTWESGFARPRVTVWRFGPRWIRCRWWWW